MLKDGPWHRLHPRSSVPAAPLLPMPNSQPTCKSAPSKPFAALSTVTHRVPNTCNARQRCGALRTHFVFLPPLVPVA